MKHRNTNFVVNNSFSTYRDAINKNLMQVSIKGREGKVVIMPDGQEVVEFINCSYLGIDQHPKVIAAGKSIEDYWGVNFCCARSRFSVEPMRLLEEELSELFRGRAIVFPSVTTTHISVMPLLASGILFNSEGSYHQDNKVRMIFDRFAHSSMQFLKPILAEEATIATIPHNNLEALVKEVKQAKQLNETAVYVADGIYSMGGLCPIDELLKLAEELDFYLYIDDAHGTSIIGDAGEGSIMSKIQGNIPSHLILTFCLSKGFGCNGGGVLLPSRMQENLIRCYGQIYAFSAALDFSIINACREAIKLHKDGTVKLLQNKLKENIALYDQLMGLNLPFSPIRMINIGNEHEAIKATQELVNKGFFTSVAFFPIVPRNQAQIRICLSATHTKEQIEALTIAIKE